MVKKKRPRPPFPGLSRQHTRRNAREFVDFDYVESLDDEAKKWLEQFSREYYQAHLRKGDETNLHDTDELRRDCYTRSNQRRRDLWNERRREPQDPTDLLRDTSEDDDGK